MMDVQLLSIKILQSLRKEGLEHTLRKAFEYVSRRRAVDDFDLKHGTDTGGKEPLWKFEIVSPNARFGTLYEATNQEDFVASINFLREDPSTFAFIDLGCGKGRTLMMASSLGFKQVIGVEFAFQLAEIARRNLTKMRIPNAFVTHADAADFRFPDTDMVIYLYNPFSQDILRKVVGNLGKFASRRLYVIYKVPDCAEVLDSCSFLVRLGCPPGRGYIQVWRSIN